MNELHTLYNRLIKALNVDGLSIPLTGIKFFKNDEIIPEKILELQPLEISITSCQANKQASLGDAVLLTKQNIGCIAAAITFGLVDQDDNSPFNGPRVYTDIMKEQAEIKENFKPPTPRDFTKGNVYACKDSGKKDFCLFGKDDVGRFKDRATAQKAIKEMIAIQPPIMKGAFFFSINFNDTKIQPDVVVLNVRPVELTRIIQGYQYNTGKRVIGNMGPVRVVNSDLIVRPYLSQEINFSSYCIGARLIAQYSPNKLGIGFPWKLFKETVQGVEDSATGYPFELYPGAQEEK